MGKGRESDLDPGQSYRSGMRELIAARWGAVWRAVPVAIAGEDIEGVHDVRVASRRLRAAMDVAVGCFPDDWYRPLHAVAKEITGALGEVRDRDVLIEHLTSQREAAAPGERPGIDRLIARVDTEREVARGHMLAFLAGLDGQDVAGETARRFGPAAGKPDAEMNGKDAG
jgi:CHAD domain-containing protein